jgi:hypothetical protein
MQRNEGEEGLEVQLHALLKSQHHMEIITFKPRPLYHRKTDPPHAPQGRSG